MTTTEYRFTFGTMESRVYIAEKLSFSGDGLYGSPKTLVVCDRNTEYLARRFLRSRDIPCCVLPAGEEAKTWESVERILTAACAGGLGRDGLIIGVGGGVITDLAGFAASIYMRGVRLRLVSTSLLGMVDASVGGKTGFDFLGVKNLIGAFYPAEAVYMPLESLAALPRREWKSGLAEVIKTAILAGDGELFSRIRSFRDAYLTGVQDDGGNGGSGAGVQLARLQADGLKDLISRTVEIKGRIVEEDPRETGERRALLNLGHTFGHALEASAGLGRLTHGEAVAWGVIRACELGHALGLTPIEQALEIRDLLQSYGYTTEAPHPDMGDADSCFRALWGDKKKKDGKLVFIVPSGGSPWGGARKATFEPGDARFRAALQSIINGEYHL
ncbi:MAG: 3-dehydroquinate synthase [Spirochaetaceae bacterium]|nr:3-dehydroquinate synthase [Spirochaetaceae bacterium]